MSTKAEYLAYETPGYEVVQHCGRVVLHDKRASTYSEGPLASLPKTIAERLQPRAPQLGGGAVALLGILIVGGTFFHYSAIRASSANGPIRWNIAFAIVAIYSIFQLVVHETCHISVLRLFGRRHDKVGFKMHLWVLPAVFVRMNQTVLLHRNERFAVHAAGLAGNIVVNSTFIAVNQGYIRSAELGIAIEFVFLSTVFNLMPLINSDGYRMILALSGNNVRKGMRNNLWYVEIFRILSGLFSMWYIAHDVFGIV